MKHLKKYFKAFTLVELVIVITILTILGTISFISFQDYFADARDANRVTTIGNIENALNLQKMKTRKFPTPANATSYTGGNSEILQGVINKEILPDMSNDPKDPLTEQYYTYSIFENGKYYQIASQLENAVSYKSLITTTYADDYESVKVVGNYKFDPSLPSLLLVPSSITASGIFDPNVCFLLNGGKNTLTSCNEKKSQMSLKDYDKSLVGYWDMETLSGTKLKDLSGNGNDGNIIGGIVIGGEKGVLGYATRFSSTGSYISINDNPELRLQGDFTINILVNAYTLNGSTYINPILVKGNLLANRSYYLNLSNNGTFRTLVLSSLGTGGWQSTPIINLYTPYLLSLRKNGKIIDTYLNRNKVSSGQIDTDIIINNTDQIFLGHNYWSSSTDLFNGIIDDVKIYNRALSDQEIDQQAKIAGF